MLDIWYVALPDSPLLCLLCYNDGPGIKKNGPAVAGIGGGGGLWFKNKIYFQIFFSRTARLRCLKLGT